MNTRERAACVCFDGDRVLLIRRFKAGRRYAVLPGGGIERGESPEHAAVRELREETGLDGAVTRILAVLDHDDRRAHYLLMAAAPGVPTLGGLEALAESQENHYQPLWVPVAELPGEPLVPAEAREVVLRAFADPAGDACADA